MSISDGDRRRLRLLWVGAGLYFLFLLNALRYLSRVPYQTMIVGTAVNLAVLSTFLFEISKVYKKSRNEVQSEIQSEAPSVVTQAKPRNIRALWVAAGLYFVAMLIGLQCATKVPYQVLLLAAILNMAILITFFVKLRKAYLKPRGQSGT